MQFREGLDCSGVSRGVLVPSFPLPIYDAFNCESVNQMIYNEIIERN